MLVDSSFFAVSAPELVTSIAFGLSGGGSTYLVFVIDNLTIGDHGPCGNGTQDAGEQCDDGNNLNGDGCGATCKIELPSNSTADVATTEPSDSANAAVTGNGSTTHAAILTKAAPAVSNWEVGGGGGCAAGSRGDSGALTAAFGLLGLALLRRKRAVQV